MTTRGRQPDEPERPLEDNVRNIARAAFIEARDAIFPDLAAEFEDSRKVDELERYREYRDRPVEFAAEILGETKLHDGEKEILLAARDNPLVAIRSCRKAGKTHTLAILVLWFVCTREAVVITIAAKEDQLKTQLWAYIAKLFYASRVQLPGKMGSLQWIIGPRHYARGFAAGEPEGVRGFHAAAVVPDDPNADVTDEEFEAITKAAELAGTSGAALLIVIDEATGVEERIHQVLAGALQGNARCVMASNPFMDPDAPHTFARAFKHNSGWYRIHFTATECDEPDPCGADFVFRIPNWLTRPKWVADCRRKWGEKNPLYLSDVLGRFSSASVENQIIPMRIIRAAEVFEIYDPQHVEARHIGIDIGASDEGDPTVAQLWINGRLCAIESWNEPDTMVTAGKVRILMREWAPERLTIPGCNVHLDCIGIGKGIVDRLREMGLDVDGVDFGGGPWSDWVDITGDMPFANRKTELFWALRRRLEEGIAQIPDDPKYEETRTQLTWLTYKALARQGGTALAMGETKKELKARYQRSPDHADAAAYAGSRSSQQPILATADMSDPSMRARLLLAGR